MPYPSGVTYAQLREHLNGSDAIFPNSNESVAEFRPHSQTIHLHTVSGREVIAAIDARDPQRLALPFAIIAHEITHWLDMVATVWGQRYLLGLFDAYEAAFNQGEGEWWKVIHLFDEDRRVMFPRYYKIFSPQASQHNSRRPWTLDYTCGQEFGPDGKLEPARPIFFTVFGENPSRERVARQPLSVGTLLETVATWAELLTHLISLENVQDEDEKLVAKRIWAREAGATLYNPALTEYTAPIHLLSVKAKIVDPIESYRLGAAVASVCLNLTEKHFSELHVPHVFADYGPERLDAFRAAQDRGFAFACLAFNAPEFTSDIEASWLNRTLNASNLPGVDTIYADALATLESIRPINRWPLDDVRNYLLEIGRAAFSRRGEMRSAISLMDLIEQNFPLPLMFDSEGELFGVSGRLDTGRYDPEVMFNAEWELQKFTSNFLMGCRGTSP